MSYGVTEWLEQLGLGRYAESFEENAIGLEHLPDLDHETLKEIGIRAVGHRMTILKAAADLKRQPDTEARQQTDSAPPTSLSSPEGERRQLTVMFCDLVGSTELSQRLDPEDLREVNRAYQDTCKSAIERYEGYIARFMGDGVLAYFGYPQAHEDDAERAIHAGLDVVESVAKLNDTVGSKQDIELGVRVGVATGLVVAGDIVGDGAAEEHAVVGQTPNLAARLQQLAEPNTVLISAGTHRLLEGLFECQDLGTHRLKGISEPVHAWRVVRVRAVESRFDAAHEAALTSFVGRQQEIALLLERWQQAKEREGQVVLLSGEAGIGKSRVVQTLRERLRDEPHTRVRYQCSPYHASSALYPVISQLQYAAGFAPADSPERRFEKLETLLAQSTDALDEIMPLFAALLSLPARGRYQAPNMTPQRLKERTLHALVEQLAGLARRQPVLFILEDAHWVDPTTQELMEITIEQVQSQRVLMVVTFRPDFEPPWSRHTHVTALTLNRLGRRHCAAIVENVAHGRTLPAQVLDHILDKTDGVPLFVEELTKTLLESDLLTAKGDHLELTGPLPSFAIPERLKDSLTARLDRLAGAKEVAQTAAALGRSFDYGLLAAVVPVPQSELDNALAKLVSSGLVYRRGLAPDVRYEFKHALIREIAYQSLLKVKRQQTHERIGSVLEERFPEVVETQPELLAYHYTEAGCHDQAISFWQQAGDRAHQRSAYIESCSHLTQGLALLESLPESRTRMERELQLQIALGGSLLATKGYGSREVADTYSRAREICEQLGDRVHLFPTLYGQWVNALNRAEQRNARALAEDFIRLAGGQSDSGPILVANRAVGISHAVMGEFDSARSRLEFVVDSYDYEQHRSTAFRYGQDLLVTVLSYLSLVLWHLGYPDRASEVSRRALEHAEFVDHVNSIAYALHIRMFLDQFRGDAVSVHKHAHSLATIAQEQSAPLWRGFAATLLGWAQSGSEQRGEGIACMRQGMAGAKAAGSELYRGYFLTLLALAHMKLGEIEEGLRAANEALEFVDRTDERWHEAEAHRVQGELLLADSDQMGAEDSFKLALEVARAQEAKSLELRAAMSLARMWKSQGKRTEAREFLAPAYDRFTEGLETGDLKNAKALLGELS